MLDSNYSPENLRTALRIIGWSTVECAKRLGVSTRLVQSWLTDKSAVTARNMPECAWQKVYSTAIDMQKLMEKMNDTCN